MCLGQGQNKARSNARGAASEKREVGENAVRSHFAHRARCATTIMVNHHPSVVDNVSTLASTGMWTAQSEELLAQWAADAQRLGERNERRAATLQLMRTYTLTPTVAVCAVMCPLSLIVSGDAMRWVSTCAFLAVALSYVAEMALGNSSRRERSHNYAGKYFDMLDEINAVLAAPFSHRPPPDAFMARMKERLHPTMRPMWSGFR